MKKKKPRGRPPGQWALYKGDNLIDSGLAKDIAANRGITVGSLMFLKRPARLKRLKDIEQEGLLFLVRTDDDEEDEELLG